MGLLDVINISHSFGDNVLYNHASFELFKGEHMGIVGQNGAGKTTLINTIIGKNIPDDGEIRWQNGVTYGYLDQYAKSNQTVTVFDFLKTAFTPLYEAEKRLNKLYEQMAVEYTASVGEKASKLQAVLENDGFYEIDSTILKVANGLGITAFGMDHLLGKLSGGQRAKVILAKLLLEKPDVLLLDEPTNFLDKEHIEWLSEYLINFQGAFIVISHDFDFLVKITNCICDIEFGTITKYNSNFSKFLKLKEINKENYIREYQSQQKQIEKTEDYIARNKARASTAKMARGRQKQLDRLERIAPPKSLPKPDFRFHSIPIGAQRALEVQHLEVGYTGAILPELNLKLAAGRKITITGFNGIGKSTFLKTLIGQIPAISGSFYFADYIKIAYYEQELKWDNPKATPLQIVSERFYNMSERQVRSSLAQCGIEAKNVTQAIDSLSGGEQSRVKLCILLNQKANLLILDEPTNHLDVDAKNVLKRELIAWQGNIILVSHEESFYKDWTDQIVHIGE